MIVSRDGHKVGYHVSDLVLLPFLRQSLNESPCLLFDPWLLSKLHTC